MVLLYSTCIWYLYIMCISPSLPIPIPFSVRAPSQGPFSSKHHNTNNKKKHNDNTDDNNDTTNNDDNNDNNNDNDGSNINSRNIS